MTQKAEAPILGAFDAIARITALANSLLAVADDCDAIGLDKLADRIARRASSIIEEATAARRGMSLDMKRTHDESRDVVGQTLLALLAKSSAAADADAKVG